MSIPFLPSGISVSQAKKDAKKLAQNRCIPLHEAQDKLARKHGRAKWPVLMNQLLKQNHIKVRSESAGHLPKESNIATLSLSMRGPKSTKVIVGSPLIGASFISAGICESLLRSNVPVVYVTSASEDQCSGYLEALSDRFKSHLSLHRTKDISDLDVIQLDGAVLIIDDISFCDDVSKKSGLERLIHTSMHTVIRVDTLKGVRSGGLSQLLEGDVQFLMLATSNLSSELEEAMLDLRHSFKAKQLLWYAGQYTDFLLVDKKDSVIQRYYFPKSVEKIKSNMGTCALCDAKEVELRESHIIPKFVYDWIKETSITGHLRSSEDINIRSQDGLKVHLLCSQCELSLSKLEKQMSSYLFKAIANYQKPKKEIQINDDVRLGILSIFWRILVATTERECNWVAEDVRAMNAFTNNLKLKLLSKNCDTKIHFAPFFGEPPYYGFPLEFTYNLERSAGGHDIRFFDSPHRFFAVFKIPFMYFYIFSDGWDASELDKSTELSTGKIDLSKINCIPDVLRNYINHMNESFLKDKRTMKPSVQEKINKDVEKVKTVTGSHKSLARSGMKVKTDVD